MVKKQVFSIAPVPQKISLETMWEVTWDLHYGDRIKHKIKDEPPFHYRLFCQWKRLWRFKLVQWWLCAIVKGRRDQSEEQLAVYFHCLPLHFVFFCASISYTFFFKKVTSKPEPSFIPNQDRVMIIIRKFKDKSTKFWNCNLLHAAQELQTDPLYILHSVLMPIFNICAWPIKNEVLTNSYPFKMLKVTVLFATLVYFKKTPINFAHI